MASLKLKQRSALRLLHHGDGSAGLCAPPDKLALILILQPQPVPDSQSLQEYAGPKGHPGPSEAQVITTKATLPCGDFSRKREHGPGFPGNPCDLFLGWWWVDTVAPCMLGINLTVVHAWINLFLFLGRIRT